MSRPNERQQWLEGKGVPPGIAAQAGRNPQVLIAWLRVNSVKGKKK